MGILSAVYARIRNVAANGATGDSKSGKCDCGFNLSQEIEWETKRDLQPGDTISCHDGNEMLQVITELYKAGVVTDWYSNETSAGRWILHVVEVKK